MASGSWRMNCAAEDCGKVAVGATGIALYPPKAVMDFYKTDSWLTRVVLNLPLCQEHLHGLLPFELIPRENLQLLANMVEKSSGTVVDLDASKVVSVGFNDPEYLALLKMKAET